MKVEGLYVRAGGALRGPFDWSCDAARTVALLGDRAASQLLTTLAGRQPPARGSVQLASGSAVSQRARIAHVGRGVPPLPQGLTVAELGAPMARFSLAHLARTRTERLTLPEARAVAIALALTSASTIVTLDEPLRDVAPEAAGAIRQGLRDPGRLVVLATCSRELAATADLVVPVDQHARGTVLTVRVAAGIHAFAAALPPGLVLDLHATAAGAGTVRVVGQDAARAVARAASHADVLSLQAGAP